MAGVLTGNALGVLRVGLTAYLLGTHSRADSLAVAMGPIDTLNSALTNSMVFAFVPMLTACAAGERVALFRKLSRGFLWVFSCITLGLLLAAPWLMRALAPGLAEPYFGNAVELLRILSLSTFFAASAAVYWALLYTDRRFGLAAFYQAALNVFTVAGAIPNLRQHFDLGHSKIGNGLVLSHANLSKDRYRYGQLWPDAAGSVQIWS